MHRRSAAARRRHRLCKYRESSQQQTHQDRYHKTFAPHPAQQSERLNADRKGPHRGLFLFPGKNSPQKKEWPLRAIPACRKSLFSVRQDVFEFLNNFIRRAKKLFISRFCKYIFLLINNLKVCTLSPLMGLSTVWNGPSEPFFLYHFPQIGNISCRSSADRLPAIVSIRIVVTA